MLKGLIPYAIVAVVFAGAGSYTTFEVIKRAQKPIQLSCPPAPPCNCPPSVDLQSFDLSKLNNKKGNFTYAPQLNNVRVVIEAKDSTLLKQLLKSGL